MIRRFLALAALGWRTFLYYLGRPFRRQGLRERQFVEQFLPDLLLPLFPATRDLLVQAARCTGCGLCDARCALEERLPPGHIGPSYIPLGLVRSLPDLAAAQGDLGLFKACGDCRACEGWCPHDVPLAALLEDASALLARLDRRRASVQNEAV